MPFHDFTYLGKRPSDFGAYIHVVSHDIGFPSKIKTIVSVPFSNQSYDFSTIGGVQPYNERKVTYVINVVNKYGYDQVSMHELKTEIANWLYSSNSKAELYDDKLPDYHFLAELQEAADLKDDVRSGELTVVFTCYPFMIANKFEGDDDWDTFDFDNDIAQDVDFEINGSRSFELINNSVTIVTPQITTNAALAVRIGQIEYQLPQGTSQDIPLEVGTNTITVTGSGKISFAWHREVI
ncbi:distal tail protein Dit [Lacticaseibacillus rhamnosus]|uniref:distal tail protein Dit n=1 Tax=Lacticaseibacillus rhamnosus TaxID=47715 RepID=UPI0009BCD1B5|nr:distal tail protein Dit [Lacticaseibacillus rhamnosus]